MPTTSGELKIAVAAFMHRQPASFLAGTTSFDVLLKAMNNARLETERLIDFELSKVSVDLLNMSVVDGIDLVEARLHGTNELVNVKKIKKPYLAYTNAVNGLFPIGFTSQESWIARVQKHHEMTSPKDNAPSVATTAPFVLVQVGTRVFVVPPDATNLGGDTINVYLDVLRWLPKYVTGDEQDFLLENCFDWLMYRTIEELNFFLKEDERVQLSAGLVARSWEAVTRWNANLILQGVDDTNLD
jgi:hypothetical protein